MKRKITGAGLFLVLFFSFQVIGILAGKFTESKYFCWAPYDEISLYEIRVVIMDNDLNSDEIRRRYRKNQKGRENRSIHNLISIVRQYETTYGAQDEANVEISYITNGHRKETWIWPKDEIIPEH
ncbi:MAG: hypothetical protein EA359_19535 [Balneolaceae bacterium]|nr:MAG: hypothetical protein EA359_19535 [Balneolaceae bacterium]